MWLSPNFTFWVANLILPILCGVGLFLLLLLCLQSNPASPSPNRKGVIRKVKRPWTRSNTKRFPFFCYYFHFSKLNREQGQGNIREQYGIILLGKGVKGEGVTVGTKISIQIYKTMP